MAAFAIDAQGKTAYTSAYKKGVLINQSSHDVLTSERAQWVLHLNHYCGGVITKILGGSLLCQRASCGSPCVHSQVLEFINKTSKRKGCWF